MKLSNLTNVINKQNIGAVMSRLGSAVLNPNTLTGIAVVGVPVTIGLTVAATRKAMKEVGDSENEDFFDKARRVWKYYVPVVASGTMCIVCIVASNRVSAKERAALASALAVSEEALKQYQSPYLGTILSRPLAKHPTSDSCPHRHQVSCFHLLPLPQRES